MTIRNTMEAIETRTTYCYSYHRISSKKQIKGGGIKRQIEASAAFCEEQGWIMDTTFTLTDIGKSAYHGRNLDDKAALGSFLNAIEKGLVKRPAVLLVESLDRISRANIMDALEIFIRILNTGITICTYIDRMVYNKEELQNNFAPLIISITLMCRSHDESLVKAKRSSASWQQNKEKIANGHLGRKMLYPKWIDISSGKPEIIERKADIVRKVFDLCINHNMGLIPITHYFLDKDTEGFNINPRWVQRMLSEKKALGLIEPKKTIYQDGVAKYIPLNEEIQAYPAIIDEETFYAARAAIQKRMSLKTGRPSSGSREINFFRKILRCGICSSGFVMSGTGHRSSYRCIGRINNKNLCGFNKSINTKPIQQILLKTIAVIDKDDMFENASSSKKSRLSKALTTKQAELEDKQTRKDNLAELVEAGSTSGVQRVVKLEREIEVINHQIKEILDQLDQLSSPSMAASIDHINAFHQRFQLGKATKEDQMPFIDAMLKTIDKIVFHLPEEEGQRTIVVIHLLSGINIRIDVFKDYSANVYKGKKCILRIDARK
ncbi:recombinase family protein [Endozoicomonas atrinae]|uniref:recombinase family protein n=1 Tax=Endozoicomonas atrinae TaxID=1333660 RepID=UPI003B0039FA